MEEFDGAREVGQHVGAGICVVQPLGSVLDAPAPELDVVRVHCAAEAGARDQRLEVLLGSRFRSDVGSFGVLVFVAFVIEARFVVLRSSGKMEFLSLGFKNCKKKKVSNSK